LTANYLRDKRKDIVVRNWAILTSIVLLSQTASPAFARKKDPPPPPACPVDTVIRTADPRVLARYSALAGCQQQVLVAPADVSEYVEPEDTRISSSGSNSVYALDNPGTDRAQYENQYAATSAAPTSPLGAQPVKTAAIDPKAPIKVETWRYRTERVNMAGTGTVVRIAPEFPDATPNAAVPSNLQIPLGAGYAVNTIPTLQDTGAPAIGAPAVTQNVSGILAMRPRSYKTQFDNLIAETAVRHRIDPLFLHAVIQQESGYKAFVVSHAGARGLMQIMPATGRSLGVSTPNLTSAPHNVDAGARLLRKLYYTYNGNFDLVLAAYNAGEGAVAKYGNRIPPYKETQNYVKSVMARYYKLVAEQGKDGSGN
jgi:soluble lytic murein transglycosylase-like protein